MSYADLVFKNMCQDKDSDKLVESSPPTRGKPEHTANRPQLV